VCILVIKSVDYYPPLDNCTVKYMYYGVSSSVKVWAPVFSYIFDSSWSYCAVNCCFFTWRTWPLYIFIYEALVRIRSPFTYTEPLYIYGALLHILSPCTYTEPLYINGALVHIRSPSYVYITIRCDNRELCIDAMCVHILPESIRIYAISASSKPLELDPNHGYTTVPLNNVHKHIKYLAIFVAHLMRFPIRR
jgi:hypothetical protein